MNAQQLERSLYAEDAGPIRKGIRTGVDIAKRTVGYYTAFLPKKWEWTHDVPYVNDVRRENEKGFTRFYGKGGKQILGPVETWTHAPSYFQENKDDLPTAYERFWSGQNRPAKVVTKAVYSALGGNEKPVRATLGTHAFSGAALHAVNPANWYTIPSYVAGYLLGGPVGVAVAAGAITGLHVAAGIPVAYKKWKDQRNHLNHPA